MIHTYRNPWAKPFEPQDYTRHVDPVDYLGCQLFRVHPAQWDVVKAGVCIAQRCSLMGAKYAAELVLDLPSPSYHDVRDRAFAEAERG